MRKYPEDINCTPPTQSVTFPVLLLYAVFSLAEVIEG